MKSKELLSVVLGVEVENIVIDEEVEYTVLTGIKNDSDGVPYEVYKTKYINIYELAHKCKEWAYKQGVEYMWSGRSIQYNDYHEEQFFCNVDWKKAVDFRANTELDAIFKACEWILENKDKQ